MTILLLILPPFQVLNAFTLSSEMACSTQALHTEPTTCKDFDTAWMIEGIHILHTQTVHQSQEIEHIT